MSLTDSNIYIPPQYDTMPPPLVGDSYIDPVFGTTITRLTDAESMGLDHLTQHYSIPSAFSLNNKWLLLLGPGGWRHIFTGDGQYVRKGAAGFQEARWSRTDPDVCYYALGNRLRSYNAQTDIHTDIRTFPQYSKLGIGKGKSDLSDNNRTTIIGDDRYIFIYDIENDVEYIPTDAGSLSFNWACPTPDGDGFAVQWQEAANGGQGLMLYDVNGVAQRQLLNAGGHGDFGRDVDGKQVYFQSNAPTNPKQPTGSGKALVKVNLVDGTITELLPVHYSLAMHASASAGDGWVYVGLYAFTNPDPANQWYTYSNEIVRVRADGSVVERLAHHRSKANRYWLTPRGSISMDGKKFVYASDFRQTKSSPDYTDVYLIDLVPTNNEGGNMSPEEQNAVNVLAALTVPWSDECTGAVARLSTVAHAPAGDVTQAELDVVNTTAQQGVSDAAAADAKADAAQAELDQYKIDVATVSST